MKKVHLIDDAFLRLESPRQPLHIGMLLLFEPPRNAPEDFAARIYRRLRQSKKAVDLFNQRLVEKRGVHYWEKNDDFDLEHHFVHLALPKPGRIRELLEMVSRLHCGHLDRTYPLWRMYLIEGIEDGRIAVYMKMHHSLIDGVGGMQLLMSSLSASASESKKLPPFWETERKPRRSAVVPAMPAPAVSSLGLMRAMTKSWRGAIIPVIRQLRGTFKDFQAKHPDVALAGEAPKCIFNEPISGTRRFAAQSYSARRVKEVARAFDATSNDVILAMVAGALRKYLLERNELPGKPLTAGVPISLQAKGSSSDAANKVAFTLTSLATHIDDPVERMRAIKRSMDYSKSRLRGLSAGQMQAYASLALVPGALNVLLGRKPENTVGNVVVSNVPGPRQSLYWQGARLSGIYPISLLLATGGLNITIVSGRDTVDFGIIACRRTVPSVQRLLVYLEDALVELSNATGGGTPAAVKSAAPGGKSATKKAIKGTRKSAPSGKTTGTRRVAKKAGGAK